VIVILVFETMKSTLSHPQLTSWVQAKQKPIINTDFTFVGVEN
jgi:hypothetical protein